MNEHEFAGEEEVIEFETTGVPVTECEPVDDEETLKEKAEAKKERASHHLKDALRQVESFGQALGEALQGRGNVVMVRVNDEALNHLDMLVDAEITKSRSESAAFLINEGINANELLFDRIRNITQQIAELREQLRQEVKMDPAPETIPGTETEL
jgi:light-regulated signal transduction histidine kinase (bacteriophytochrome)